MDRLTPQKLRVRIRVTMKNIFLILLGATITSFGMVLQKIGIQWMDLKKSRQPKYMRYLWLWLLGMALAYVVSSVPNSIAAQTLPPHIITMAAGWIIVMIVFLSKIFLKEQVYRSDILYSFVIMGMTILIASRSKPAEHFSTNRSMMVFLFLLPCLSLLPLFFKSLDNKRKSILLSVYAGCLSGLTIVFFDMTMRELFTWDISRISVDILILYVLSAVLGAAAEQASYRIGEMKTVAVVRLSLYIVYPVLGSLFLFGASADPIQLGSIAVLIFCCYGILKRR